MKESNFYFPTDQNKEFYIDEGCHIIEILNKSSHPDISISQARVEPHSTTEIHYLKDTVEIYYILSGSGTAYIDDQQIPVKSGDLIHIPKDINQYISNKSDVDLVFLCICTPRWKEEIYKTPDHQL